MTSRAKQQWDSVRADIGADLLRGMPGFVGLHRPYIADASNISRAQLTLMKKVSAYLEGQMLSRRLIDLMMNRPSNDIYWLTDEDRREIGNYPPEQEELFIKKCGYDRHAIDKVLDAAREAERIALLQKQDRANECVGDIIYDAKRKGWNKIKSGWLPRKHPLN